MHDLLDFNSTSLTVSRVVCVCVWWGVLATRFSQKNMYQILPHLCCWVLCRDSCHRDIVNLQVEMVRQFCIQLVSLFRPLIHLNSGIVLNPFIYLHFQSSFLIAPTNPHHCAFQNEFHELVEKYSVNSSLVEEIEKLKEENRRLRANY